MIKQLASTGSAHSLALALEMYSPLSMEGVHHLQAKLPVSRQM